MRMKSGGGAHNHLHLELILSGLGVAFCVAGRGKRSGTNQHKSPLPGRVLYGGVFVDV